MKNYNGNDTFKDIYDVVWSAKTAVQVMLEHMESTKDPIAILTQVRDYFTSEEAVVVSCGYFVMDEETKELKFMMPTNAKVAGYLKNGIDKYKNGYTRVSVLESRKIADDDSGMTITTIRRYVLPEVKNNESSENNIDAIKEVKEND